MTCLSHNSNTHVYTVWLTRNMFICALYAHQVAIFLLRHVASVECRAPNFCTAD